MAKCKLRQVLKDKKMTQHDLAEKTGLSEAAVSCIASNKRGCTVETALLIMKTLDMKLEELWEV